MNLSPIESFHAVCEAVMAERRAWLAALVTETRNRAAGPFVRHVRAADEPAILDSHPFVLVVVDADGNPAWSFQAHGDTAAIRFHLFSSPIVYLAAEQVAERRDWLVRAGESIARQVAPGCAGRVWARTTLSRYDELSRGWSARMREAMEASKL